MAPHLLLATAQGLRDESGAVVAWEDREVTALALADDGWLAVLEGRTVVDDGGDLAAEVGGGATCLAPWGDGALVGTEGAGLLRVGPDGVAAVDGFTAAEGRNSWYTPWGGPPATRSLAVAPDGTPFVNVHVGGILRSRDGGDHWEQTLDIDVDVHQVVAPTSGAVLAACGVEGLAVSGDGGDTWRFDTGGLHATYCRAVAVAGDVVLLSASTGPSGGRAAVYRRALDGDGDFERCTVGLPTWFDANIDTHRLQADGSHAAFAAADGRVFVSDDAGASWTEVGRHPRVAAVAVR